MVELVRKTVGIIFDDLESILASETEGAMQKYAWKVVTAAIDSPDPAKNAENQLNHMQDGGYEVFATHALPVAGASCLVILGRKPKVDDNYDRRY